MSKPYQTDINSLIEESIFKGKAMSPGTVRNWSGKSWVKQGDGEWIPVANGKSEKPVEEKPVHHQANSKGEMSGVNDSERAALKEYQSGMYNSAIGGYANLQSYLRSGKPKYGQFSKEETQVAEDVIKNVSSAIQKHPVESPMTVYRGLKINKDDPGSAIYSNVKPGDTIQDKGFTSTSTDKKVSNKFSDKLNRSDVPVSIDLKPGDYALPMDQYHKSNEKEILLDKDVKFKVVSVTESKGIKKIKLETGVSL
jgi:hypothetical protein